VPLQHEFGWTTAEISSALSIRFILFGLMAPFRSSLAQPLRPAQRGYCRLADRGLGAGDVAGDDEALAVDAVVGRRGRYRTGMTALVLGATVAARWFPPARAGGRILTASVATGQLVFLPMLARLTERMGWRVALALMCGMLGVAAFAVLMIMRDRPSDLGLRPYGDDGTEPLPAPAPNTAPIMAAALGALRDAAKTRVFWILFATFFICGASTTGLIQVHLIPMCLDYGIPQVQAASLLAAMGIFDFFGTILSGWLSDRYDNRYLLFWYYGLRACRYCSCPSPISRSTACRCLRCFMASTGSQPCRRPCGSPRSASGRKRANLVFGWIYAGHQLAQPLRHSAPACRGPCSRHISRHSSPPAHCASSRH